jgi:poly(hydroxyalkanoate) depolymerase family esterase
MELIDWRELYAANRAVIEGGRDDGGALDRVLRPASPPDRLALDAGAWQQHEVREGGRARRFHVYTPPGLAREVAAPVVVMLHGCTQTPTTFATGALMNRTADRHGFVAVYPEQSREDNPQGCWNWFTSGHQARGRGEPAFIAAATQAVLAGDTSAVTVDPARVYVAGMSAGGAMASIMAATYPDLFAAVAVHSGLAYRSATTLPGATSAMSRGGPDPEELGRAAFAAMGSAARPVPAIVVHGTGDHIVAAVNGQHVVRQWMATNRLASGNAVEADFAAPAATSRHRSAGGRDYTRRQWTDGDGALVQELIEVDGMGHAWSGGAAGGSYTDPRGPSASDAIWDFFARAGSSVAAAGDEVRAA